MSIFSKTLEETSDSILCSSWKIAFADYGMSATEAQLLAMFKRRGYAPEVSIGAFITDEQMISLTLNGVGCYNGISSAYDTSTGTVKEYRRQGLARRLFNEVLPLLRARGIEQYILEVLRTNDAAKTLYQKMGFSVVREFCFFRQSVADVSSKLAGTAITETVVIKHGEVIELDELPDYNDVLAMWEFHPSWQNSHESMRSKYRLFRICLLSP